MIQLLIGLVIVGLLLYIVENYIPLSAPIKLIIRVVVVLLVIIWLLNFFGLATVPMRVR